MPEIPSQDRSKASDEDHRRVVEGFAAANGETLVWFGRPSVAVQEARPGVSLLVALQTKRLKSMKAMATVTAAFAVAVPLAAMGLVTLAPGTVLFAAFTGIACSVLGSVSARSAARYLALHRAHAMTLRTLSYAITDSAVYLVDARKDGSFGVVRYEAGAIFQVELDHEDDILLQAPGRGLVLACLPDAAVAFAHLEPFGRRITRTVARP